MNDRNRNHNSQIGVCHATGVMVTEIEFQAVERVKRAHVKAPDEVILSFVRFSGAESILRTKLCDINAIANAF
jgi:hypothetical protein